MLYRRLPSIGVAEWPPFYFNARTSMPVRDLRAISSDEHLEADFCIVGSGPAGATIALGLARTRAKGLLAERGGLTRDARPHALNDSANAGGPRAMDQC